MVLQKLALEHLVLWNKLKMKLGPYKHNTQNLMCVCVCIAVLNV